MGDDAAKTSQAAGAAAASTGVAPEPAAPGDGAAGSGTGPRRIVLFADGTGNAYGGEPSNIWRLYQALDLEGKDQIAHYIPGVGTQSMKILRVLDGMTGFGVPSNVRKLYRFLCWNWRPGDEVWLFGFSRGAFTIRTLIGMIASQGLVPPVVEVARAKLGAGGEGGSTCAGWTCDSKNVLIDHRGMQRLTRDSWRAYRAERAKRPWWSPITPMRSIRDAWLSVWSLVAGHHDDFHFARARDARKQNRPGGDPDLRFVGLFDTVAAYGVPIEEARKAIDKTIFPLVFKDNDMSPLVRAARHALSLDDERTTFHPVRIGHAEKPTEESRTKRCENVEEVWFAGAHSDVGGGYPDDGLAQVALHWMVERIEAVSTTAPLRFDAGFKASVEAAMSPFGPRHDSRAGTGVFYRYAPRDIAVPAAPAEGETSAARRPAAAGPCGSTKKVDVAEEFGGAPVIHQSVVQRMLFGSDRYAPVALPAGFRLETPPPTRMAPRSEELLAIRDVPRAGVTGTPSLDAPDPEWRAATDDAIWWRRVVYFATMAMLIVLAALPILSNWLGFAGAIDEAIRNSLAENEGAAQAAVAAPLSWLEPLLPGWLKPWTALLVEHPLQFGGLLGLFYLLLRSSWRLRDRIADSAHRIWFRAPEPGQENRDSTATIASSQGAKGLDVLSAIARYLRRDACWPRWIYRKATRKIFPALFVLLIYSIAGMIVLRIDYEIYGGAGGFCADSGDPALTVPGRGGSVTVGGFRASSPCWDSGVVVERGRHYTLRLTMSEKEPFFDRTVPSGAGGFTSELRAHWFGAPLKRWWRADWFQPIARVGRTGADEWPLVSADGSPTPAAGRRPKVEPGREVACPEDRSGPAAPPNAWETVSTEVDPDGRSGASFGPFRPIPDGIAWQTAIDEHHRRCLPKRFVAKFTAPATGRLYLYLNDAVLAAWPFTVFTGFYANNRGEATVEIREDADW